MKNLFNSAALAFGLVMLSAGLVMVTTTLAFGYELTGYVSVEGTIFTSDALQPEQENSSASLALAPELYHEWENGSILTFAPYARLDNVDSERTHFDIRELNYLLFGEIWEFRLGVGKVFWGTTESVHLVDIVNQTDLVEDIDGEDKLGQPMASLSLQSGSAELELFLLPWFRERTFPGENGRPRTSWPVETGSPVYESADEDRHFDLALRAAAYTGVWDLGFSLFSGTSREPRLVADTAAQTLIPHYDIITQFGIDLQATVGPTLWKCEATTRDGHAGQSEAFQSVAAGLEHTLYGIGNSATDLGLLAEYLGDNRGDNTPSTLFEHDLFVGTRLAFNNTSGTTALLGAIVDLNDGTTLLSVESEGRLSDSLSLTMEILSVVFEDNANELADVADDDYVVLRLRKYF